MTEVEDLSADSPATGLTARRRRVLLTTLLITVVLGIVGRVLQDDLPEIVYNVFSASVVVAACSTVVALVAFTVGRSMLTWLVVLAGISFVIAQCLSIAEDIPALDNVVILGSDGAHHRLTLRLFDFTGLSLWIVGFFGVVFELSRTRNQLAERSQSLVGEMRRNEIAAKALSASDERYRHIVEESSDIIFQCDLEGNFIYANSMAATQTGYSVEEIVGNYFTMIVAPEAHEEVRERTNRLVRRHIDSVYLEFPAFRKDGTKLWIGQNVSLQFAGDEPSCILAIARDITERKNAELALRSSEERYRELMEATGVIPWEADAETFDFSYIGPQVESILGYPQERWFESGFFESILHDEDRDETLEFCKSQTEQNRDHEIDYRIVTADGGTRWIRDIVTVVAGEGAPTILRGIFVDVTQIKEAEEERRQLQEQMQHAQKLESLGVLAGGIAHDFNNFLTGIMGNADLALHQPEEAVDNLETIVTTAKRAGELCQQLLAYSGRGKIVVKPHDLSELVTEIGDLLEVPVSKKADILYSLSSELPAIEGDSTQIRQVIMNLVTNASESIEHTPGTITITTGETTVTESDQKYSIEEGEVSPGCYVYADVMDNGCGMERRTRSRMFDPFYTTKFSGRGLGLAAVLGIMRSHEGGIRVESAPGMGTTVRLLFPVSDKPVVRELGPTNGNGHWRGEGLILIVDDEAVIRDFVAAVLVDAGFEVVTAEDGEQAVKRFREHAHNLTAIVLDLTMPKMNGAEAHREMRGIREGVPVVVISGFSETEVTHSFSDTALGAFLQKPFRGEELIDALRGAIT